MRGAVGLVLAACVLANSANVFAQFRGPGGGRTGGGDAREGGRFGGQRGEGRSGGDESREGGRPGGPPDGQDRTARLEGFLRSMDADGDGVIHESEVPPERLRMFRFMAERAGVDPSQGVPIERVVEAMGARRAERPVGGDGGREQPPGQTATDAAAASRPEAAEQPTPPAGPPLVPGFGTDRKLNPVPGFGTRVDPPPRVVLGGTVSTTQRRVTTERGGSPAAAQSEPAGREEHQTSAEERSREGASSPQRASYRFLAPHERLPEGLPDWFIERDLNMDGQVTMAEFAGEWTDEKVEKFLRYDRNNDGIITVEEALNPLDGPAETAAGDHRTPTEQHADDEADPPGQKPAESDAPTPWWLQ